MKRINEVMLYLFIFFISITSVYAKEKVTFSKCVDGDTIKVEINNEVKTVRFLAVDTPESVHPKKGVEYYGKEASNYTCDMVSNANKIELEYDNDSDKTDKYGRLLAWVWVDGELLQDNLIKNGYAEVAYLYGDYKYTDLLKDHEALAEARKIGVWNDEARKEFDPNSNKENLATSVNSESSLEDFSTTEIIVLVIIAALVSIFAPTINKAKRKLNKLMK